MTYNERLDSLNRAKAVGIPVHGFDQILYEWGDERARLIGLLKRWARIQHGVITSGTPKAVLLEETVELLLELGCIDTGPNISSTPKAFGSLQKSTGPTG